MCRANAPFSQVTLAGGSDVNNVDVRARSIEYKADQCMRFPFLLFRGVKNLCQAGYRKV